MERKEGSFRPKQDKINKHALKSNAYLFILIYLFSKSFFLHVSTSLDCFAFFSFKLIYYKEKLTYHLKIVSNKRHFCSIIIKEDFFRRLSIYDP